MDKAKSNAIVSVKDKEKGKLRSQKAGRIQESLHKKAVTGALAGVDKGKASLGDPKLSRSTSVDTRRSNDSISSRKGSEDSRISRKRSTDSSLNSVGSTTVTNVEVIPHQVTPKPHFERSLYGLYPHHLKNYVYELDPIYNNFVFSRKHKIGDVVVEIDLSYWSGIRDVLAELFMAERPLEKVTISGNPEANDAVVSQLLNFTDTLRHLQLSNCPSITSMGINQIVMLTKVTSLDVSGLSEMTDEHIHAMCDSMCALTELNIGSCRNLSNKSLTFISESIFCSHIEKLIANYNPHFSHVGMNPILFKCSSLGHLDLSHCMSLSFIGIVISADTSYGFSEETMKQYVSCKLKTLNLTGCPMNDDALDWIAAGCPDLTVINVAAVPRVSSSFIQALSLACLSLQDINLRGCKSVDSTAVHLIARCKCRDTLTSLNVSYVAPKQLESAAIKNILERCGRLQSLDVSGNVMLNEEMFHYHPDPAFSSLAPTSKGVQATSCLTRLCMGHCSLMSSNGIIRMAKLHSGIEFLDIAGMCELDDTALSGIADNIYMLQVLRANDCLGCSGEGIEAIAEAFPNLVELHIGTNTKQTNSYGGRVEQYSDKTLKCILKNCRKLLVLDIRNQCGIKMDSAFFHGRRKGSFAGHCYLRTLKLQGADNISPSCMKTVVSKMFALEDVVLPAEDAAGILVEEPMFKKYSECLMDDLSLPTNMEGSTVATPADVKGNSIVVDTDSVSTSSSIPSKGHSLKERRKAEKRSELAEMLRVKYIDPAHPKHLWDAMFKHCCYSTFYKVFTSEPVFTHIPNKIYFAGTKWGWAGLYPDKRRKLWRIRDHFVNRMMDEKWAVKKIQYNIRLAKNYRIIRDRCTATRIQRWYRLRKIEFCLYVIRDKLFVIRCALRIQRNFRNNLLPSIRAVILLQTRVRAWKARNDIKLLKLKHVMATKIQRIARGMLVRLSDWFILAQIYVKLPPFWKTVIHSVVPDGSDAESSMQLSNLGHFENLSKALREENVDAYEINKQRKKVQHLLKGIEAKRMVAPDDIGLANGEKKQLYLAPKMAFVVPQSFDKNPYASRHDGKKIATFKSYNDIVRKEVPQEELVKRNYATSDALKFGDSFGSEQGRDYVHQFTYTFWPMRQPEVENTADVSLFDPKLNGFDLRLNSKETLHCDLCGLRLRLIHCSVCVKGFCFFCAFKAHADGAKRNHHMQMAEPRIVESKEASKSLVYHLDMAQKTTYDIKYLVGFLKSTAEVNRIQNERKIKKEMADLAEKRKEQAAAAALVSKHLHDAATKIANTFRKNQAKKYVNAKRCQAVLEESAKEVMKVNRAATLIQTRFRIFSVRNYFFTTVGERFRVNFKRRKKIKPKKSAAEELKRLNLKKKRIRDRVLIDVHQRRLNDRNKLITDLYDEYAVAVESINVNTEYWLDRVKSIKEKLVVLRAEKKAFAMEYKTNEGLLNAARSSGQSRDEIKEMSLTVKALYLKRGACAQRVENYKSMNWWISHHVRSNCRRATTMQARLDDMVNRVRWFSDEHFIVDRIKHHLQYRRDTLADNKELRAAKKWMNEFIEHADKLAALFDAMQESLFTGELRRIRTDVVEFKTMDSLVRELLDAMKVDAQYAVERTYLDCRALYVVGGSDEAVYVSTSSLELKKKQTQLQTAVIDNVKIGLDGRLGEEDKRYIDIAAFPDDADSLEPHQMPKKIKAQLVDKFVPRKHFDINSFMDIVMSQPWMANQALEDVHLEEELRTRELHLDEVRASVTNLETTIVNFRADCVEAEKNIKELDDEIVVIETEDPKYFDPEEWAEMQTNLERFKAEIISKNAEIRLKTTLANSNEENLPEMKRRMEFLDVKHKKALAALEGRTEIRMKLMQDYIKIEDSLVEGGIQAAVDVVKVATKAITEMKEAKRKIETVPVRGVSEDLINCEADVETQQLLNESNYEPKYRVLQYMHLLNPSANGSAHSIVNCLADKKAKLMQCNIDHMQFRVDLLNKESTMIASTKAKKAVYDAQMKCFVDTQMLMRRQHSLQRELNERKKRLKRMRGIRMEATRKLREAALAAEKVKAEELEAKRKAKEEAPTISGMVADKMKKTIRKTADEYRRFKQRQAMNMDAEEERMATYIRLKTKTSSLEAIRQIKITGTALETQQFQKQNDILADKGLPFYKKLNRGIGSQGDVFVWVEMTSNSADFVTHIDIGHSDPEHPLYKKLSTFGYEEVSNPNVKLVIWIKRDKKKNTAINALRVSYESGEEARLIVDEFQRVGQGELSLDNFGLPDVYLWYHKVDKDDNLEAINTNAIIGELNSVRKMRKERPDDVELQKLEKKLVEKLSAAHSNEVEAQGKNPISHAVDLLALTDSQLQTWMKIYAKVDTDRSGAVEFDELCEFLNEPPTKFIKYVFDEMDTFNSDGVIEFADFLRSFAIFCMFGKDEVKRYVQ